MWLLYHVTTVFLLARSGGSTTLESVEPRIVGDRVAGVNFFPFMVQILVKVPGTKPSYCGGSIISSRHVLTSAKCVTNYQRKTYDPSTVTVIVGRAHHRRGGDYLKVQAVTAYPVTDSTANSPTDLAGLTLYQPFTFSSDARPLRFANEEDEAFVSRMVKEEVICLALGWVEARAGDLSPELKVSLVQLKPLSRSDVPLPSTDELCVTGLDKATLCSGDSGGPVICENVQVGVVPINITDSCIDWKDPYLVARIDRSHHFLTAATS